LKPNFDREGREVKGISYWLGFLFRLGGDGFKSALARWALVAMTAFGAKRYQQGNSTLPAWLR